VRIASHCLIAGVPTAAAGFIRSCLAAPVSRRRGKNVAKVD
jgi:hypothetical protein